MLKAYHLEDLPTKCESPLTPSIIKYILKKASSNRSRFIAHLIPSAFFFVIRLYEYDSTLGEPRT